MLERTFLFVPGHRPDRFDKAVATGADLVILDLEDAVPPEEKHRARAAVSDWLRCDRRVLLRVNAIDTPWFSDDCRLLSQPGVVGVMLPKAETRDMVRAVAMGRTALPVWPLIESARGFDALPSIARAPGVRKVVFGSVDLQAELGMSCEDEELLFFRSRLVMESRLAGLAQPVDGVCTAMDDEAQLVRETMRSRRLGFGGKLCIHPKQVPWVAQALAPTDAELTWARRVVEADHAAGGAAVRLGNQMIDKPVVMRARAMLQASSAH